MQRAVWAWLDWVSADSGSSDEPAAIYAGRKLVEEIEAGDKYGVGELIQCCREVRLRAPVERLRKERDKLKEEQESFIQDKMELRERITELMKERDDLKKELSDSNICNQNLKPLEDHLGIKITDARRSGDIAARILQEIKSF
jgi:hypothetical protein